MASLVLSFGGLFQVSVLLVNAIAVLSEDRFLARIGWSSTSASEPSFGSGAGMQDSTSFKARAVTIVTSVRTLFRPFLLFVNVLIIIWSIAFG